MSEQSSPTSQTASAFYDPDSSSWRTSQGSLLSEEYPLLERLPDWATTADGALCVQATPEHLTAVRDGSASLATPTAWLGRRPSQAIGDAARWHDPERSNEISDQMAALLPTPTSQAAKHGATPDIHANGFGSNLWDLPHLLPTPVVNDMGRGKTPEEWDSWTDEMKGRHGNGNGHGASLAIEAARLLPTPRAQNAEPRNMKPWIRPLDQPQNLENAIARLPGLATRLPSNDGNESSDDPHPTLPIAEDCDPSLSSG